MELTREILAALGAPFTDGQVEFLPRGGGSGTALAAPYIEARDVMARLDQVVGPENWHWTWEPVTADGKMVKGFLTVCGITKCDAGQANTEDETLKSAVSDALKRSAVMFGIGRYLYYLPKTFAKYDQQRKQWAEPPQISPAAIQRALVLAGIIDAPARQQAPASRPAASPGRERAQAAVEAQEQPLPVDGKPADENWLALRNEAVRLYQQLGLPKEAEAMWTRLSEIAGRSCRHWSDLTPRELGAVVVVLQGEVTAKTGQPALDAPTAAEKPAMLQGA